jgi:putative acetyltransferase
MGLRESVKRMGKMSRRDAHILGPVQATVGDIDELNRVFSEAFTDRYHRDGLKGIQVPQLNPEVWGFALASAQTGAMIWREPTGGLAAFNIVHLSGVEGWMGPLAVRPPFQGLGLGSRIVTEGLQWLRSHGATQIGLETMPRTVDNIGFYAGLGFHPGHLTLTMIGSPGPSSGHFLVRALSAGGERFPILVEECRQLIDGLAPGVDYSRELHLTQEHGLGDTTVLYEKGRCRAFAVWHTVPLARGGEEELRVLKLVADGFDSFEAVLSGVGMGRGRSGRGRVSVRCQTAFPEAYSALVRLGFRIHWTDLRMLYGETPERSERGIVFSNWEI